MNTRIRGQELPIFDGIMAFLIKKRRIYMKIRKLLSLSLVVTLVVLMLGSMSCEWAIRPPRGGAATG